MLRLRSPWLLGLVLVGAVAVWSFTIGPWGPWHWRTAAAERLVLRGRPGHHRTLLSPWFTLHGGRLRLQLTVTPVPSSGASALPAGFVCAAQWWVTNAPATEIDVRQRVGHGTETLRPPASASRVVDVTPPGDRRIYGAARLRLRAAASGRAVIVATLSETTDVVRGIPVLGIVLFAWLVAFFVQTMWTVRRGLGDGEAVATTFDDAG